jgi:hypothetical protein
MNEFCVNFERLILGKFAKGSEHAIVEKSKIPQRIEHVLHQACF